MWGLDAADPKIAIAAMQAMNASVRNVVFAPAFFGTPIMLLVTAGLALVHKRKPAAAAFGLGALIYFGGGLILTMLINVPMNETLAVTDIPTDADQASQIWLAYSGPWQFWNGMRTIASGASLVLVGIGLFHLHPKT